MNKMHPKHLLIFSGLFLLGVAFWQVGANIIAEQSGSSPNSNVDSRINAIYDAIKPAALNYGSDTKSPDLGAKWNRIYTAATWEPSGADATPADVSAGKTFYGNNRSLQTGQAAIVTPPAAITPTPTGDTSRINTLFNTLKTVSYGSESAAAWGDWGAAWNRIYSAAIFPPVDGNAAAVGDVAIGKTLLFWE